MKTAEENWDHSVSVEEALRPDGSGLQSSFLHSLVGRTAYLTSLSLSFLTCKMGCSRELNGKVREALGSGPGTVSSDASILPKPSRTRATVLHLPVGILREACQAFLLPKAVTCEWPLHLGLGLAEATSVFLGWWIQMGFDEPTSKGVGGQGGGPHRLPA